MKIKDGAKTKTDLTMLNSEMIIKDPATKENLGFVILASEDTPDDDDQKAITSDILNKKIEEKIKVIDAGTF